MRDERAAGCKPAKTLPWRVFSPERPGIIAGAGGEKKGRNEPFVSVNDISPKPGLPHRVVMFVHSLRLRDTRSVTFP